MTRFVRKAWSVSLIVALAVTVPVSLGSQTASGAPLPGEWNPGNIISDAEFYDSASMTEAEIQSFLERLVPVCETWRSTGPSDPIICLKTYRVSTETMAPDSFCPGGYAGAPNELASTIIYKAAQSCGINPRVILVTLQKEVSLVDHTWPSLWRYERAMGYGCSDTAPCIEAYGGLQKQVFLAAKQFQRYRANPTSYNYRAGRYNNIYFFPPDEKPQCGYAPVFIDNVATASLYNYTPYQPNGAALANLYGTGDGCSSYGNRNFWRIYADWFGTSQAPPSITTTDGANYLIAMDSSWELWAYPTNGAGGWKSRASLGPGWQGIETIVGIGDFDDNGHRDVIGVDDSGVGWFYGGDGRLEYPVRTRLAADWTGAKSVVYAGDFDGDGLADVFTTDESGALWLWPGHGDGTFESPIQVGTDWNDRTLLAGPGDFDQDGCGDLIGRLASGDLMLYPGTCDGAFKPAMRIGIGWGGMTGIYSLGDFTGDGISDLLAQDAAGSLLLFPGVGGGGVRAAGIIGSGWGPMRVVVGAGDLPGTLVPREPAPVPTPATEPGAGDLDGDGNRDILGVTLAGSLRLYRGDGAGGTLADAPIIVPDWGTGSLTVTLGDFTGDGLPDVGRIATNGVFEVFASDGSGGLASPYVLGQNWRGFDRVFGVDFDGDGLQDVIAREADGTLWLYRGNGTGDWLTGAGIKIGIGWGSFTEVFSAGDFDGAGGPDVIARTADGSLWLYPTNGTGLWQPRRLIGIGWSGFVSIFSPGDYDGSGGNDVVARRADGRLYLYRGDGSGSWMGSRLIDSGWNTMGWIG
ncbi:VCBS repeat-containing protein [Demequina sp. TTPB684]|uniref:FG-GAP-like repeat-containing protein n=1 Tax=unclassified Demequina TaxID=2620311 RepID=UPI001CF5F6B3|nr:MULTISPECIES: FG-GAP-like repeat-containing protein [unclassified Demequina]MCB2413603.1 VCBS repeat-containing protein [Demequina sp. TTPB684]UPU88273.1 VCBS repeat-containing protein [Demequina sp. TMPB413]